MDRIVSFLASPDPSASKGPVVKKPKAVKKVENLCILCIGLACAYDSFYIWP